MYLYRFYILITCLLLFACNNKPAVKDQAELEKDVEVVGDLLYKGEFEKAQEDIGKVYLKYPNIDNPKMQYYLLCFESEILYYSAIFTLGADKANEALSYCKLKFKNDSDFIGNAYNLLGINSENFVPATEAIEIYKMSERYLSDHNNSQLSFRYHVLSNLGQLYAKNNFRNLAVENLMESNTLCLKRNVFRTLCINHIALSKLYAEVDSIKKAQVFLDSAEVYYSLDKREDLALFLVTQKAILLSKQNKKNEALQLLREKFDKSLQTGTPSMGLYDFYKETAELLTQIKEYGFAEEVSLAHVRLQEKTLKQEYTVKERLISRYYKTQEIVKAQRKEQKVSAQILKDQRNILLLLAGLLLALLLLALVWVFYFLQRRKLEKMGAMIEAILSERDRISRDFHDGIAPNLSTIKLICEAAIQNPTKTELINKMPSIIDHTIDDIRRMVNELSPRNLVENGLHTSVSSLIENLQTAQNIHFTLRSEIAGIRYPAEIELNVFRVLQEAVNNAIKHSKSKVITVEMYEAKENLVVVVSDHGNTNENISNRSENGNGMRNMRTRIELLKGELEMKTERNRGTKIKIVVPLLNA